MGLEFVSEREQREWSDVRLRRWYIAVFGTAGTLVHLQTRLRRNRVCTEQHRFGSSNCLIERGRPSRSDSEYPTLCKPAGDILFPVKVGSDRKRFRASLQEDRLPVMDDLMLSAAVQSYG
jgi:hypothetical protein